MKKKVLTILMLVILFLGIIYKPIIIKADSGFDSSYDSGSSSSSSSDWSSSDWNSYGVSHQNSPYNTISVIIIASLIAIVYIIAFRRVIKTIKETINEQIEASYLLKLTTEEIQTKLPNLNIEEFNKIVFNNYKEIQIAWMNFDLDTIKNLVSDEIYNMYSMQLDTLKVKGQKNMMENINYVDNYICNITIENDITTISTILSVTCYDYIVDNNNKVIRGSKNKELYYTYRLTFTKNSIDKNIDNCPNCGAKINSKKDTKCHYCGATIVNNNSEWIMTKKEMLGQQTK